MFSGSRKLFAFVFIVSPFAAAQEMHVHSAPERLGSVSFPVSCATSVQREFERGVALLHSFAYAAAEEAFQKVAEQDPQCGMARWGIAMTHFHQLWEPPISPDSTAMAEREIAQATRIGATTVRERGFIRAAALVFRDPSSAPYPARALNYERAMANLAAENEEDVETQVFYALSLLANASPADSTHLRQKKAADLLEPLYRLHPQHPGIAHYLIHACDNAEMAARARAAAEAYSKIAPSAPHALHMPSHIFTRLGLWPESIASNTAARAAARRVGDTGEELHAMDYLTYAYLQSGRDKDAAQVLEQLKSMPRLNNGDFKIGYAATAIPIRYLMERNQWAEAAVVVPLEGAPPHVVAIALWARGLGLARSSPPVAADKQCNDLQKIEDQLQNSGNLYWATQVRVMKREVMAWSAQGQGKGDEAIVQLRGAADEEDSIEKLPVTPGPIVPAREQLGELLLGQGRPKLAAKEFETVLANTPGRRGALRGAAEAAEASRRQ